MGLTWKELTQHVKKWSACESKRGGSEAHTFVVRSRSKTPCARVYCLGAQQGSIGHELLFADVNLASMRGGADIHWSPLINTQSKDNSLVVTQSKASELLRERQRVCTSGLTSYSFYLDSSMFLFALGNQLLRYFDVEEKPRFDSHACPDGDPLLPKACPFNPDLVAYTVSPNLYLATFGSSTGGGPAVSSKITDLKGPYLTAGEPAYVIQEEFDRYDGHWWQPVESAFGLAHLLYEETDTADVPMLSFEIPGSNLNPFDDIHDLGLMSYPRAGKANAKWRLRMFRIRTTKEIVGSTTPAFEQLDLPERLDTLLGAEYLVRAGWMPDGAAVWAQLVNREQNRLVLAMIPLGCFVSASERSSESTTSPLKLPPIVILRVETSVNAWIDCHDHLHFLSPSQNTVKHAHASSQNRQLAQPVEFIWSSQASGYHNLYHVQLSVDLGSVRDQNGGIFVDYSQLKGAVVTPIVQGPFDVPTSSSWHVCEQSNRLYYVSLEDSPIEPHIYRCMLRPRQGEEQNRVRLTPSGCSFWSRRSQATFVVDDSETFLVTVGSSIREPPFCVVVPLDIDPDRSAGNDETRLLIKDCPIPPPRKEKAEFSDQKSSVIVINGDEPVLVPSPVKQSKNLMSDGNLPTEKNQYVANLSNGSTTDDTTTSGSRCTEYPVHQQIDATTIDRFIDRSPSMDHGSSSSPEEPPQEPAHPPPEVIPFDSKLSGQTHYAMLFRPAGFVEGTKYPTILFVYAGPEIQLVVNTHAVNRYGVGKFTSLGYAVLFLDGRGSQNRGNAFREAIRFRLGTVEMEDQVEGLQTIAALTGCLDLSRVVVRGWSYGGYASLMLLMKYPDLFRAAIVGAPVTAWELYDTAYTERYMGTPDENPEGYLAGSVVAQAGRLPREPGRLLLLHGMIDENVHFTNTAGLVSALIRERVPYQLQVYPESRHGLRAQRERDHLNASVMWFIQQALL